MKRIVGFLLLLVFIVPAAVADKKKDEKKDPFQRLVGDWQGSMKIGSRQMTLVLHVVMGNNGRLVATVDSPTQAVEELPAEIQYGRGMVIFVMPRLDARFDGRVDSSFSIMQGYFSQHGDMANVKLKHFPPSEAQHSIINDEPDKPTVTTDFLGDWAGDLKTGEKSVRFILHIRRNREGTVATVDSPDQDTFGIKVPSIASDDTKLSFNIPELKLSFQGVVDPYRASITGTLTQDGKPRPLSLTKS